MTPGSNPKIILYRKKYIFRFKMKTSSTMSILMRFYIIMISTKECIFQNRNKSDYEINLGEKKICISYLLTSLISSSLSFFIFLPSFHHSFLFFPFLFLFTRKQDIRVLVSSCNINRQFIFWMCKTDTDISII